MPLNPGTKLGPYEVLAPLGAGGMGEVYRARDSRLGRDVAIKVLPPHLSQHPEVRARFEREAKSVSALNHPNICVLYDVGREGDVDYLVMELIEGETLATRIMRGPLPATDVVRIGAQVADALDRAHRAGVIHRDLKPGNVMLTKSGAKLMDFGLARAASPPRSTSGAFTQSPTMAQPLTAEGTIVGTFQYMSPEQLEGKDADARADLWSLGCVIYEMATGKRAFEGSNQASLISAIMRDQPRPMSELSPMSPPTLDRLVGALLEKDPADRIQTAHDVKLQLQWTSDAGTSLSGMVPRVPARSARRPSWLMVAMAAGIGMGITAVVLTMMPRGQKPVASSGGVQRYILGNADIVGFCPPKLSPDGQTLVISARSRGTRRLVKRDLSSLSMDPIPGADDAVSPFFSPDGAWVGFMTATAIKKIPLNGGAPQLVTNVDNVWSADWSVDGNIYYCPRSGGSDGRTAVMRVPAIGGTPELVAALDSTAGESEAWLPTVLPDGKTVLYSVTGGTWRTYAMTVGGKRHLVAENAVIARYVAPYLLYYDTGSHTVLAAPFDLGTATITGPAISITEPVDEAYGFDAVPGGGLVYVPNEGPTGGEEVVWLDGSGAATPAVEMHSSWAQPRISPDGSKVMIRKAGTACELWLLDISTRTISRVTQGNDNHNQVWSPDGSRIVYERIDGPTFLVSLSIGGAREASILSQGRNSAEPHSWSEGGNLLFSTIQGRGGRSDITMQRMDGASPREVFIETPAAETSPVITRDGKWLAYVSDETGTPEVYVRAVPDQGTVWQISAGGGDGPMWSHDGRKLYYAVGSRMMMVSISTTPTLTAGNPVLLFDGGFSLARTREYDVAPDGRVIAVRHVGGAEAGAQVRLILNWQEDLQKAHP